MNNKTISSNSIIITIIGFFFFLPFTNTSLYSDVCKVNDNTLMIEKDDINVSFIKEEIIDSKKLYEDIEIKKLKSNIKKCRSNIDNNISILKTITSDLVINKQKLLKLKDINSLAILN